MLTGTLHIHAQAEVLSQQVQEALDVQEAQVRSQAERACELQAQEQALQQREEALQEREAAAKALRAKVRGLPLSLQQARPWCMHSACKHANRHVSPPRPQAKEMKQQAREIKASAKQMRAQAKERRQQAKAHEEAAAQSEVRLEALQRQMAEQYGLILRSYSALESR